MIRLFDSYFKMSNAIVTELHVKTFTRNNYNDEKSNNVKKKFSYMLEIPRQIF